MSTVFQYCTPCGKPTAHHWAEELTLVCVTCKATYKVLQRKRGADTLELIDDAHLQDIIVQIPVPVKLINIIRNYKHGNIR